MLWVQNSHPAPIPPGAIGAQADGRRRASPRSTEPIAPFASRAVDVAELLPGLAWPRRSSCTPASISCARATRSSSTAAAASPMSMSSAAISSPTQSCRARRDCSARAICCRRRSCRAASGTPCCCRRRWRPVADASCRSPRSSTIRDGSEIARHRFGRLPRDTRPRSTSTAHRHDGSAAATAMSSWSTISPTAARPTAGCTRSSATASAPSGHAAETSFGAHVFNTILTYRDEPQSYSGRPPGLSTRLFLRLGDERLRHACHLIYPGLDAVARRTAPPTSSCTTAAGCEVARAALAIPCSGSRLWRYHELFDAATRARAGRRRLCDHPRHDLPAVRLSRAHRPRRRLQPRPHVRVLSARCSLA